MVVGAASHVSYGALASGVSPVREGNVMSMQAEHMCLDGGRLPSQGLFRYPGVGRGGESDGRATVSIKRSNIR